MNEANRCIKNLLRLICLLQENSENICQNNDCTRPFLGPGLNNICYNTRVITLYNKNGELFTAAYIDNTTEQTSSFFKVVSINDNTATLLILSENDGIFSSTNNYITINICCICAIRCITDTLI